MIQQELSGNLGTVDFESLMPGAVFRCRAEIVEHGADVGEFGVGRVPAAPSLEHAPQVHPPRVVE